MSCALIVIAKAPVPGRVKTRLCPPCSPEQAADLARAALQDTLRAVVATPATRRVCVLDGAPQAWIPASVDVVAQRGGGLDERLAAAFEDVGGPALLVGMDTPQLTPALLGHAAALLGAPRTDAVLGAAVDGGFWAIGLREPAPELFLGVPMSTERTGAEQLRRLRLRGLRVRPLPVLRDVDTLADAEAVASECPVGARFPAALAEQGWTVSAERAA